MVTKIKKYLVNSFIKWSYQITFVVYTLFFTDAGHVH